jgi:iron-sulfur cluster assembly protein
MVTLTEKAAEKIREAILEQEESGSYEGVRLTVVGGGCSGFQYSMRLESKTGEEDSVFDSDGLKVIVGQDSLEYLNGTEVDFVETPQGAGFKFNNPNVKSTCGCGESFQA